MNMRDSFCYIFLDFLANTLSQYLEKRELLQNPDEQKRLVDEVPEIVAEELEPECEDDDDDRTIEDSLIVPNPEAHQSDKEQRQRDLPVSSSVKKSQENSLLLKNPEEQLRLLCDVPDVVAEKLEPEFVDDDGKLVNDVPYQTLKPSLRRIKVMKKYNQVIYQILVSRKL